MRIHRQRGIVVLALCVCLATESSCFLSPSIPLPASASGAFLSSPRWSSQGDAAAGVGRDGGKGRIPQLSTPMMAAKPGTKALIVGAGPAGILSAHYLLRRGYDVTVAEKRDDPRKGANPSLRSYSLGLGVRGRGAIKGVGEDLWKRVTAKGVMSQRFCLHLGKRIIDIRQKSSSLLKTEPSCLINRADLCSALLEGLEDAAGADGTGKLSLSFGNACESIDLANKKVSFEKGAESYDLLVAADGVNSMVRSAVLSADPSMKYASAPLNGTQKIIHQEMPAALDSSAVHAMSGSYAKGEKLGFFWVPERNRTTGMQQGCVLVNWDESSAPKALLEATSAEEAMRLMNEAFPLLVGEEGGEGVGVTLDAARQFMEQRPSVNTVNKLSSYHSSAGNVVILGDAAHSSGGASGQGCNAALQDAQVLDQLLSEVDDDISKVLPLYSERRVPDGHALLDLSINQGPKAPALRVIFLLASFLETLGHSLLPSVVNPPVQNLLTQTDWSFTKIYNSKKAVLDFVKKSNEKYGVFTGY